MIGAQPAVGQAAPREQAAHLAPSAPRAGASSELRLSQVSKSFGQLRVLDHVGFTVEAGQFATLLGPSGCGKTTLLRIIAGLEVADRGQVALGGNDISALPANRRPINTVFQNYALFPHLSVYENIAFGLRSRRFAGEQIQRRVRDAMQMLQLDNGFEERYPDELSGGQKQRVALARALVNEPEVLLLDEPMSALDAKLRAEVQLDLRRLQRRLGKTFILVTHDQDEAMTVSDRILVMQDGRIVQSGTPLDVYEHPVNRFVARFLGLANLIPARRGMGRLETAFGAMRVKHLPQWESGTLAIRPERIRVSLLEPAGNAVSGVIRELIYRGDHIDLFVEPGELRARVSPTLRLAAGQRIWLELPPEHLEVLAD